jgi:glycyl-tRNA synthetase beta chain
LSPAVKNKKKKDTGVMADFLLEIGLEEVPARMIAGAEAELGKRVTDLLTRERLLGASGKVTTHSTPRRLAVLVEDVLACQADTEEKLTGPSWKVAFKDGVPTAAAEAFAKKAGVPVASLEKITNAKGEYVGATVKRLGLSATLLLAAELGQEYVLACRKAGTVCKTSAVGCCTFGFRRGSGRDCGNRGGEY